MPRKSPYTIDLTTDERERLEAMARQYTLSYRDVIRAKLVLLASEGLENKKIGEILDLRREVHRGKASIDRLEGWWDNLRLVHLPVHASWLNQIEIYFSVFTRKAWTPDDFASFEGVEARSLGSRSIISRSPSPSNGSSPARISQSSWPGSTSRTYSLQHDIRVRTSAPDH